MIKEINFSRKAVEKINQLISKKPSGTFFRIAVKGGGCSGFKYDFTFDNKIDENDLKHQNIVVDKSSCGPSDIITSVIMLVNNSLVPILNSIFTSHSL